MNKQRDVGVVGELSLRAEMAAGHRDVFRVVDEFFKRQRWARRTQWTPCARLPA